MEAARPTDLVLSSRSLGGGGVSETARDRVNTTGLPPIPGTGLLPRRALSLLFERRNGEKFSFFLSPDVVFVRSFFFLVRRGEFDALWRLLFGEPRTSSALEKFPLAPLFSDGVIVKTLTRFI